MEEINCNDAVWEFRYFEGKKEKTEDMNALRKSEKVVN